MNRCDQFCLESTSPLHTPFTLSRLTWPYICSSCMSWSGSGSGSLPSHRLYDCAIDLLWALPYPSLPKPERECMENYIKDSLAVSIIQLSFSPLSAEFLWGGGVVVEKDKTLDPSVDFRVSAQSLQKINIHCLCWCLLFSFCRVPSSENLTAISTWPLPSIYYGDVSDSGLGGVLSQQQDSTAHSCAFYSCHFSPAEHNYDVEDHELLAIEEWRHWL